MFNFVLRFYEQLSVQLCCCLTVRPNCLVFGQVNDDDDDDDDDDELFFLLSLFI